MKKLAKKTIIFIINLIGTLLALYVGGYHFLIVPVLHIISSVLTGPFIIRYFILDIIKIFIASSVGGAIWLIADIIATNFRDRRED